MDERREEIIHEEPCREMLWFQELAQQDQNGYTVNKTKSEKDIRVHITEDEK